MIVQDVIDIAKMGFLNNLNVSNKEDTLVKFVYLGVSELYRRFNLSIKVETILTNPMLSLYELRSPDVSLLLSLYDSRGRELKQTDVLSGQHDYKIMNFRSFLLEHPKDGTVFAVYKASAPPLTDATDIIDLPDSMMDALLCYVAYLGHSTINKDNVNEANQFFQRFEHRCQDLDNQGYRIPLNTETISVRLKGYR